MHKEKEYCICDLSLDLDYINAEDVDNADCLEALMLVQLQLSLHRDGERQMEMGGVANGGHLLGLIAFARKIARVLLSLSLLCCILFLSFYLGNNYDSHPHSTATIDTSLVSSSSSSTTNTITSIAINNTSSTIENNNHLAETYSI